MLPAHPAPGPGHRGSKLGFWDRFRRTRADSAATSIAPQATPPGGVPRLDSWFSDVTGFGTSADKRTSVGFFTDVVDPITARELWTGDDMAAKVIEKPAQAIYRKAFEAKLDDKEQAEAVAHEHKRLQSVARAKKAKMYARAYGGAGLFPVMNSSQRLDEPLNEKTITEIRGLRIFEPREMRPAQWYSDITDDKQGTPSVWEIVPLTPAGASRGMPIVRIHESRLIIWTGIRVSIQQEPGTLYGWGHSVLTRVNSVLRDFNIGWASAAALLHDFAQAVYKKKGLKSALGLGAKKEFQEALAAIELGRSTINATVIDSEESWERQQTPMAGLPDLLEKFFLRLAAAADMPLVVLAGMSPAGLNATGQSDIQLWDDRIAEEQQEETPMIERLTELIMLQRSGPMRGVLPKVWSVQWCPLRQPTPLESAQARKVQAEIDGIYISNAVYSSEEVALNRFGGDEYSFDTHIDFDAREKLEPAAPKPVLPEPPPVPQLGPGGEPPPDDGGDQGPNEPPPDDVQPDEPSDPKARTDTIEHRGSKWIVLSADGEKELGSYDTEEEAEARLGQVEYFKREDAGDWEEDKHPRAADGKFGAGSSEGAHENRELLQNRLRTLNFGRSPDPSSHWHRQVAATSRALSEHPATPSHEVAQHQTAASKHDDLAVMKEPVEHAERERLKAEEAKSQALLVKANEMQARGELTPLPDKHLRAYQDAAAAHAETLSAAHAEMDAKQREVYAEAHHLASLVEHGTDGRHELQRPDDSTWLGASQNLHDAAISAQTNNQTTRDLPRFAEPVTFPEGKARELRSQFLATVPQAMASASELQKVQQRALATVKAATVLHKLNRRAVNEAEHTDPNDEPKNIRPDIRREFEAVIKEYNRLDQDPPEDHPAVKKYDGAVAAAREMIGHEASRREDLGVVDMHETRDSVRDALKETKAYMANLQKTEANVRALHERRAAKAASRRDGEDGDVRDE